MKKNENKALWQAIEEIKALIMNGGFFLKDEVLLNNEQMLLLLQCSKSTLYRHRKSGVIPFRKIGGCYYYPKYYFTEEILRQIRIEKDRSLGFDD